MTLARVNASVMVDDSQGFRWRKGRPSQLSPAN